jgi:hypothetical protein
MKTKALLKVLPAVVFLCWSGKLQPATAQEEAGSKGIRAEVFITNRPAEPAAKRKPVTRKSTYKSSQVVGSGGPPPGKIFAQVGVTIWRFRPATASDKTKELVEDEDAPPAQWSLERVAEGTLLAPGQRVRLGIESLSRDGYLYVFDREQYADGSFGEAHLIFPTARTPPGANSVRAGKLVYVPAAPRYFRIKPAQTSKRQVAEVLTVLVSAKPLLETAEISSGPVVIDRARLETWEKEWGVTPTKFEMEDGAGQVMSQEEQAAGLGNSELTRNEPVPQTIYRLTIKPDDNLLVTVPLRFTQPKP